jgi:hypothetical protein
MSFLSEKFRQCPMLVRKRSPAICGFMLLGFFASPALLKAQIEIPNGTVLPTQLQTSISSTKSKPGQVLKAKIAQNVPLSSTTEIKAGTIVAGHVIEVVRASKNAPAKITFTFDTLHFGKGSIPIVTHLRAAASLREVDRAKISPFGADGGTGPYSATTVQIGGEAVLRGGGKVLHGKTPVGEPILGGVLARVADVPNTDCVGAIDGNDRNQALWLFSTDACGTYDLEDLKILASGLHAPAGVITLERPGGSILLRSGSGLLLRTNGTNP